jgi:aminopeptidase N
MGDAPYESFTLAMVENTLPGGHSPPYFAQLNQALPMSSLSWRGDPAAFAGFNDFFIAHEMAHQWWGQAIGWQNYHEQWLSEGFAQYFAALYAQHAKGNGLFESVLRQMRRWAIDKSDQGPVYLGYRLGHVKEEGRVFRALVYNKGAIVLHLLRELLGDEAFFRGLRRFYNEAKFSKTGTDAFRKVMEAESGRPLSTFFERWIYGSSLPRLTFHHQVEGQQVLLKIDQVGDVFDVPVTVTIRYADGKATDVIVPVAERSVEKRVPLEGTVRGVDISRNDLSLASIKTINN